VDLLKTLLFLSIMVLILVSILAHRMMEKKDPPPRVEYKYMNSNF